MVLGQQFSKLWLLDQQCFSAYSALWTEYPSGMAWEMKGLSWLMVPHGSVHGCWAPVLGQIVVTMEPRGNSDSLLHSSWEWERKRLGTRSCPRNLLSSSWVSPPKVSKTQNTAASREASMQNTSKWGTFPIQTITISASNTQELLEIDAAWSHPKTQTQKLESGAQRSVSQWALEVLLMQAQGWKPPQGNFCLHKVLTAH